MYLAYEWLADLVNLPEISIEDLAERLSRTGLEVEGIETLLEPSEDLVVGQVLDCQAHPNADKLSICKVDVGQGEPQTMVCGAPNVRKGLKVITALPGAKLPGNLTIAVSELRGVTSSGMFCSLRELGFPNDVIPAKYSDGIMELPADTSVGEKITDLMKLSDPILDIDLTPNRADALSYRGTAYELAAIYDEKLKFAHKPAQTEALKSLKAWSVTISDPELCPEYNALLIQGVKVQESPLWLQTRLMKSGIRPINNVVDATNYILLEYGQPLHAFDADALPGQNMGVRLAQTGEKLTTLDGQEHSLASSDLVVTACEQPVALAGVMGGLATEVTEKTTNVLIEAASFERIHVRKTAQRYHLRSEASIRNERGIDESQILSAGLACVDILQGIQPTVKLQGGQRESTVPEANRQITTSTAYINQLLGTTLGYEEMKGLLERLQFEVRGSAEAFTVEIPKRRHDVSVPADLAEEVGRLYGYDHLPSQLPSVQGYELGYTTTQALEQRAGQSLRALGFDEVVTYSLTSQAKESILKQNKLQPIALAMPMSQDHSVLKTNLLTGLLDIAQYNLARKRQEVMIYELGTLHYWEKAHESRGRVNHLAGLWTGSQEKTWDVPEEQPDFYALKGKLNAFFAQLPLRGELRYEPETAYVDMHPGRTARIVLKTEQAKVALGYLGQLHPKCAKAYDLPRETYGFELNMQLLVQHADKEVTYQEVPKYPGISRDLAFVVAEDVPNQALVDLITELGQPYLKSVQVFDLYQGDNIETGKKSMAYQLFYQNTAGTLVDEEVSANVQAISQALIEKFAASVR